MSHPASLRVLSAKSMILALLLVFLVQVGYAGVRLGAGRSMGHQHSTGASGVKGTPPNSTPNAAPNGSVGGAPAGSSVAPVVAAPGGQSGTSNGALRSTPAPAPGSAPAATPSPVTPASMAPPASPSLGSFASRMLMGAALGLGVVSLAHAMGLGGEQAQSFMLFFAMVLLGIGIYGVWRYLWAKQGFKANTIHLDPVGHQRIDALSQVNSGSAVLGRNYNPKNVGNDASARPWESTSTLFSDVSSLKEDNTLRAVQKPFVPQQLGLFDSADKAVPSPIDVDRFKSMAMDHFLQLQDAWDHLDMERLSSFLSLEMLSLVRAQLTELGLKPQKTEVMMLQAQWLGFKPEGEHLIASVELSGMSREVQEASFSSFREIWSWARPIADENAAWLVCGLEPLQ